MVARGLDPPCAVARRATSCAPAAREGDVGVLDMAADVLGEIRKAKTEAKQSMRARWRG